MKRPKQRAIVLSEEAAERMVRILGDGSAIALALAEMRARREAGEKNIVILSLGESLLVGPDPYTVA